MHNLFLLLFLLSPIALLVGLIKPAVFTRVFKKEFNRKQLSGIFAGAAVLFFILFGATVPPQNQKNTNQSSTGSQEVKDNEVIQSQSSKANIYSVIKVVDGDTISVNIDGINETIRLIGINTAETVDPRKPAECFGKEASDKAKEVLTGKSVSLEADSSQGERDKYNRLLRYVFLENGINFNQQIISEGFAYEYTYDKPYKYQSEFKQAEKEAREAKRGLWADNACGVTSTNSTTQTQTSPTPAPTTKPVIVPGVDKDCKDFKTHAEAQAYFEAGGGSPSYNFDKLDSDGDGQACESLP